MTHRDIVPALTQHASIRRQQRGLSRGDLALVMAHGDAAPEGYIMTKRAVASRITEIKREIQQLEHLLGAVVIVVDGRVITTYWATSEHALRMRRHRRKWKSRAPKRNRQGWL